MAEYISKDELMQYLEPLTNTPGIVIKRYVENMPYFVKGEICTTLLDNKDNKCGYWIRKEDDDNWWLECSRCGYEPQNEHIPTAFCCNCGAEMGDYNDLVRSCETCNHYNVNTCWCSRYNDTTYSSNCSSYQVKE